MTREKKREKERKSERKRVDGVVERDEGCLEGNVFHEHVTSTPLWYRLKSVVAKSGRVKNTKKSWWFVDRGGLNDTVPRGYKRWILSPFLYFPPLLFFSPISLSYLHFTLCIVSLRLRVEGMKKKREKPSGYYFIVWAPRSALLFFFLLLSVLRIPEEWYWYFLSGSRY